MTNENDIIATQEMVTRLEKDGKEIYEGILAMEKHIQDTNKQIDQNRGALSYNQILLSSYKSRLEQLQSAAPVEITQ